MLNDSVARFIDNDYSFDRRQKVAESEPGYSEEIWRQYAELGWTAAPFAEEDGGLGGGPVELMLLLEQFGRGLVVEPYLATVVLAGGVLARAASVEQKERWLAPVIGGELQAALAFAEPQARFDLADIATTAAPDGEGWLLNGRKAMVLNGGAAGLLIVPARTAGDQRSSHGVTLFAVPAEASGVGRQSYRTVDGQRAAEIVLRDVRIGGDAVLGTPGAGFPALQAAVDAGTLAVCAEALGIMRALHEKTVEYAKNRVQFGVPVGSFQALQHRMVDMLMACEQCRSLLLWATMLAASDNSEAPRAISALKHQLGVSGRLVAQEAVQLHGGMGMTWELDIAHYFKRFTAIEVLFGNADFHLDRYLGLGGES